MHLTPELLIRAYSHGIFPMGHDDGTVGWYDPEPRAIFPLDTFHIPRRLARTVRSGRFEVRIDSAFAQVIDACAERTPDREETWITSDIREAYIELHRAGIAHSVECWREGKLVGGLYGVAIRGLFAGESMFHRESDASKVALVHLVERLRHSGFVLLDSQFIVGDHFRQFGIIEIPRAEYKRRLAAALQVHATW
jgi:leucyl/phenylalanyl-tRNA---protein transferase